VPKPFLILQLRPEDAAADNEFQAILRHGGLRPDEVERVRLVLQPFPGVALERYAGIIVGGSPYEVSTPEREKRNAQRAIEEGFRGLLERVVREDFPFLGCCSGCGLLGSFAGAPVTRRYPEPVGGATIRLTSEGREDPLLRGFPDEFRVLVGHKESCETAPPGAVLLAENDACPVQMFRVGENVYATQFHPEGDLEGFAVRIDVYQHYGYFPPERANALLEAVKDEHTPVPQAMLARFVERYRRGLETD
jgi:GMP synthase (glutamine-hydrolysing)